MAGKELSVEWVLDGSVRRSGKRIRVTVQLVNVGDGVLVWAERFDEKFTDIFGVEDSISEQVAKALGPKLTGEEKRLLGKRYTESTEAYEAYLKGRYFLDKWTDAGCRKAIDHFQQAIQRDPNYALAYAGIADAYTTASDTLLPPREALTKAKAASQKALDMDDKLAEAWAAHGHARLHVARPQPVQHVALDARPVVAVDRHRVGVAGQHQSLWPPERGARRHVLAHPLHLEPRHRAQQLLEVIGDGPLVMAHRRDVDELGRERQQVGHVVTPCSRRTSLRCSRSPGS